MSGITLRQSFDRRKIAAQTTELSQYLRTGKAISTGTLTKGGDNADLDVDQAAASRESSKGPAGRSSSRQFPVPATQVLTLSPGTRAGCSAELVTKGEESLAAPGGDCPDVTAMHSLQQAAVMTISHRQSRTKPCPYEPPAEPGRHALRSCQGTTAHHAARGPG